VAAAVLQTGRGRVLSDERALGALLEGPELGTIVRADRARRAEEEVRLVHGRMTLDLIDRAAAGA
jgi:hypothetical protein